MLIHRMKRFLLKTPLIMPLKKVSSRCPNLYTLKEPIRANKTEI